MKRNCHTGATLRGICLLVGAAGLAGLLGTTSYAQLEITELMYNPRDENVWEWIEVRNTSASAVDLNGYLAFNLGDTEVASPNPTIDNTLAENTVIGPGQVAVIYDANYGSSFSPMANPNNFVDANFRSAWGLSSSVPLIGANFWPSLPNSDGSESQSVGFWANATDYAMDVTSVEDEPGMFTNRVTSFDHAAFGISYADDAFPDGDGMSSITWTGDGSNQDGANWVLSSPGDATGAVTSVAVQVPGFLNNDSDVGNPGIAPPGTPATMGLQFTEIMYDPASPEDDWEWVEIYNSTAGPIDLSGYTLDDDDNPEVETSNIAAGTIAAGGTAILFNVDDVSTDDFAAAWGASLNLVPVTDWSDLQLSNSGDAVVLKDSSGTIVASQSFLESAGFPTLSQGPSISLADLSLDPTLGENWDNAIIGDSIGSFHPNLIAGATGMIPLHDGGDIGSPGSFNGVGGTTPGDFDGDGDVDGVDFLEWQRGNSPNPLSPGDLADWQANYGAPLLAAVAGVPEPTTLALLCLAFVPLSCRWN